MNPFEYSTTVDLVECIMSIMSCVIKQIVKESVWSWVISTPLAASGPGPSRTGQAWTDHCTKGRSVEFGYDREQAELPDTTGRRDLSDIHWKEKFETLEVRLTWLEIWIWMQHWSAQVTLHKSQVKDIFDAAKVECLLRLFSLRPPFGQQAS